MQDSGILPSKPLSHSEFLKLIDECPSTSAEGAELNQWDEKFFLDKHMIKGKIEAPSAFQIKTSCANLINFFGGGNSVYSGLIKDIKIAIIAMRKPGAIASLLFDEFVKSGGTGVSTAPANETNTVNLIPPSVDLYQAAHTDVEVLNEGNLLADEVTVSQKEQSNEPEGVKFTSEDIKGFWEDLFKKITSINSQGEINNDSLMAVTVVGLMCLHCMKLITRTPASTQKSMSTRMNTHFVDLYKYTNWTKELLPIHIKSLDSSMSVLFKSCGPEILELVSLAVGKIIIESSRDTPNQAVKGVLYGACLTHIGMHGLAPIKHVEQTALALGLKTSEFCKMICTKSVRSSLENVCSLITLTSRAPGRVIIIGDEYDLKMQLSWRFCRLYNPAHFQRFKTQTNARLIIRCAAYLSETSRGTEIGNMIILSSQHNKKIYEYEKQAAHRFISLRMSEGDEPETEEARAIYGGIDKDPETPF